MAKPKKHSAPKGKRKAPKYTAPKGKHKTPKYSTGMKKPTKRMKELMKKAAKKKK